MKLGQAALTVRNLPGAVAFHRDVLGLPFLFEAPNLAFFNLGAARLMLSAAEANGDRQDVGFVREPDGRLVGFMSEVWN